MDDVISHARANPKIKKDGRIAPSACTLTLYGANGHVTGASLSTPCRTTGQLDTVAADATPRMAAQNWTFVANKIIERERVSHDGSQAQFLSPGDETYWVRAGANVWLVQIRAA